MTQPNNQGGKSYQMLRSGVQVRCSRAGCQLYWIIPFFLVLMDLDRKVLQVVEFLGKIPTFGAGLGLFGQNDFTGKAVRPGCVPTRRGCEPPCGNAILGQQLLVVPKRFVRPEFVPK